MDRTIVFFLKLPTPGAVKTRLARAIGPDAALRLYNAFVRDMLATLGRVRASLLVCVAPAERVADCRTWLEPWIEPELLARLDIVGQKGDELGERMRNGLAAAFTRGARTAALVGADLPDLPAALLEQAFVLLDTCDVVLGPTPDGGYYCVGMKPEPFAVEAFADVAWSTPLVFSQTQARLAAAGRSLARLPPWRDVDTIEDLEDFLARQEACVTAPASYAAARACLRGFAAAF